MLVCYYILKKLILKLQIFYFQMVYKIVLFFKILSNTLYINLWRKSYKSQNKETKTHGS